MTSFTMGAVLSVTTGRLMCQIGEVYEFIGFLADRAVFTHELVIFAAPAKAAVLAFRPDLPSKANGDDWQDVLAGAVERIGASLDVPDKLRGCIADDRNPIETLKALGVSEDRILVASVAPTDGATE